MSNTHLSIIELSKLEVLHQLGLSARAIARELAIIIPRLAGNSRKIKA